MAWLYKNKPFLSAPKEAFGFIYLITHVATGKKYIGKKQFYSLRTKKVEGKRNRKHYTVESNWKDYWSSSDEVAKAIEQHGEDAFRREILHLCESKRELGYTETALHFKHDVLNATLANGEPEYFNGHIASRWFRSKKK